MNERFVGYAQSLERSVGYAKIDRERCKRSLEVYEGMTKKPGLDDRSVQLYNDLADAADQVTLWFEEIEDKATSLAEHFRKLADT